MSVIACLAASGVASYHADAQLDRGTRLRALDAFDSYDLEGPQTLEAIRMLSPTTEAGQQMGGVPRLARARAATDLWLVSYLDPERADLEGRVAEALGVPSFAIVPTLRRELESVDEGELRDQARDVERGIALRQALEAGEPVSFAGVTGVRRDALLVHLVGQAVADADDAELAQWFDDPCAGDARCDAPWSGWAPQTRVIVAALAEAADALGRLDTAWREGDPFARAVWPALEEDARRLEYHVHRPIPVAPRSVPISSAPYDDGEPARVDLLVAVSADRVRVARVAPVAPREGRLELLDAGEGMLAEPIEVPVPRTPADPEALSPLVERLRAIDVEPGAIIAVAADDTAPADRLERALAAMAQAQRAPLVAVRRASDGTLRAVPIRVVDAYAAGAPGDVLVDLRPSGYAVRGPALRETAIPRIVGPASTSALDAAALEALIGSVPGRRVVVRAAGMLPAREVIDTAFQVAEDGDLVALVGQ